MAQQTQSKRTLPKRERAFWHKVQKLVLPQLAGKVWFPSWWMSETIPEEFKEFMFDRFSSEMQSDEQSAHAWSMAVREIVRYLVNCPKVQFDVLYDYPSCDGFPFLLLTRKGKVLGLVSIYPADYYEDGVADWKELRDFLLRVADAVRAILESQNHDSCSTSIRRWCAMSEVWQVYKVKDVDALLRGICKEWHKVFRRLRNSHWRSRFRRLWERCATEGEFYELADELYFTCYGEKLPRERWAKAWQYRLILHPDFSEAIREFANAVIGFY